MSEPERVKTTKKSAKFIIIHSIHQWVRGVSTESGWWWCESCRLLSHTINWTLRGWQIRWSVRRKKKTLMSMSVECGEMTPKTLMASWRHTSTWWVFGAKKGRQQQRRKQQRPSLSIRESWHGFDDENENELKWFIIAQIESEMNAREEDKHFYSFPNSIRQMPPVPIIIIVVILIYVHFYQSTHSTS